jgi:hypothetical protein
MLLSLVLRSGSVPVPAFANTSTNASAGGFAFPEFSAAWQRADGPVAVGQVARSWLWGPEPGSTVEEAFAESSKGRRTVQYYDKARMELNEAEQDASSPWRVTTGLLVNEMVTGQVQVGAATFETRTPAAIFVAGDANVPTNPTYADFVPAISSSAPDRTGAIIDDTMPRWDPALVRGNQTYATYIPQTGHNIADVFWRYLNEQGQVRATDGTLRSEQLFDWVYLLGYPISEPYWAKITIGGKPYAALLQLFQRRTLTYIADMPEGWQVQMGNVGQHYFEWRYGRSEESAGGNGKPGAAGATPTPVLPAGAFVTVEGDKFVYAGAPIKLKGTNYWLSDAPFSGTWASWNGPKVYEELKRAQALGVNVVRIGIPFDHGDTMDVVWDSDQEMREVSMWIQRQMTQVLQIASTLGMKVIFTLFEWYDEQPRQGSREERPNIAYLEGVVQPFANDDRVLAWDIRNEPDYYDRWQGGDPDRVIEWLDRMATNIRYLDQKHPITVGLGDYRNFWLTDKRGRSVLDFVDFVSLHCYDAHGLPAQVEALKARTNKPVLVEEMGWPTSPGDQKAPEGALYDEATQDYFYTEMLDEAKRLDVAGVVQWTLIDFIPRSTAKVANFEEHFGLFRLDGTAKPASEVFKTGYTARILPSITKTYLPLDTADHPNLNP